MFEKNTMQREYQTKLKQSIDAFLINYKKRYIRFPFRTFNKLSHLKPIKNEVVKVRSVEYTIDELVKRVNSINSDLKTKMKPSYFNYIINGFNKETNKKDEKVIKLVYNDYNNQLNLIFKEMKDNLLFCLDALTETNKVLKEFNKNKNIKESEDNINMLGYITLESEEVLDLRDLFIECYNDLFFMEDEVVESADSVAYEDFIEAQKKISSDIKVFKSVNSKKDFKSAKEALSSIRKDLKLLEKSIASIDTKDEKALKASIRATNIAIKSFVLLVPSTGLTKSITLLRDEKNKNDELKTDDSSKVISQIKTSIAVLYKVCDNMEADLKEKEKKVKAEEKEVKESSYYEQKKLSIYTACKNGEITLEERENLLQALNDEKLFNECPELCEPEISKKEKFDRVKAMLYAKCAAGEFDDETREELIQKAYDMIFSVPCDNCEEPTPVVPVDPAEVESPEEGCKENVVTDTIGSMFKLDQDAASQAENNSGAKEIEDSSNNFANALANININNN